MALKSCLPSSPFDIAYHRFEFIHIPKCGGTSIHRRLAEVLGPAYSFGRRFLSDAKVAIANREGSESIPVAKDKSFASMRAKLLGAGAHVGCGMNPINQFAPSGVMMVRFAIVREPLERLASLRRHCLDHPAHRLNHQLQNPREATLKEFILANIDDKEIVNPMAHQLTGIFNQQGKAPPSVQMIDKLVGECIIDAIFSISELNLFYDYMNSRIPGFGELESHNVSRSSIEDHEIQEARDLYRERCKIDYEIYDHITR